MKICDRCGEKIEENGLAPIHFPYDYLTIKVYYSLNDWIDVDLCEHCKNEILDFALGRKGKNEEI